MYCSMIVLIPTTVDIMRISKSVTIDSRTTIATSIALRCLIRVISRLTREYSVAQDYVHSVQPVRYARPTGLLLTERRECFRRRTCLPAPVRRRFPLQESRQQNRYRHLMGQHHHPTGNFQSSPVG